MAKHPPSVALRAQLRNRIIDRIAELDLRDFRGSGRTRPLARADEPAKGGGRRLHPRPADRCRREHRNHGAHDCDAAVPSRLENPSLKCRRRMTNPDHRSQRCLSRSTLLINQGITGTLSQLGPVFEARVQIRSAPLINGLRGPLRVSSLDYRATPASAGCAFAPFGASAPKRAIGVITS